MICEHCGRELDDGKCPWCDVAAQEKYFLWYDNGSGYFDCASSHDTLEEAVVAANSGYRPMQHITLGNVDVPSAVVWQN